ncbi:MAG: hypothetical protein JXA14_11130, partial [Anaerolineae bacterium]|nr:hypothetical protein [Anaerolineae bacterium]
SGPCITTRACRVRLAETSLKEVILMDLIVPLIVALVVAVPVALGITWLLTILAARYLARVERWETFCVMKK